MSARRIPPEAPGRRGWCPGLSRPMPTGDGLLARVHPAGGLLTAAQAHAVAEGARRHGNGLIDITARANLQIRGVGEATRGALAAELDAAGLGDRRDDGGPQRLTLTSPLAGLDPFERIDVPALARTVEAVGLTVAGLPAKTLVTIDGGGRFGPGPAEADLVLAAVGEGRVALGLASPEGPLWCGSLGVAQVPGALALTLLVFAASGCRRVRDLDETGRAQVAAAAGFLAVDGVPVPAAPLPPAGATVLGDGRAVVVAEAPFGRCHADRLDAVAAFAKDGLRLTASRGLALPCPASGAASLRDALAAQSFIVDGADPRRAVAACPGAPACASGSTPVPDHAARLADAFAPFAALGLTAHVSGCAKGCAHPGTADLTLVGRDGLYGIVPAGLPGAQPMSQLTFEAALERVRRADSAFPLDRAFRTQPR